MKKNRKRQVQLAALSFGIIVGGIVWISWETVPENAEKPAVPSKIVIKEEVSLSLDAEKPAKSEAPPQVAVKKEVSLPLDAEKPTKPKVLPKIAFKKEASLPLDTEKPAKPEVLPNVAVKKEISLATPGRQDSSASGRSSDKVAKVAPLKNVCEGMRLNWRNGEKRMYAFKQRLDLETNLNILASEENSRLLEQEVINEGILNLAVFAVEEETALVGFQYTPDIFSIDGNRLFQVEELLSAFFLVRFHHTGRPLEFFFPGEFSGKDQTLLASLINSIQVVIPDDFDVASASWTLEEEDSSGHYEAKYHLEDTNCGSFKKEKVRYLSVNEIIKGAFDNMGGFDKTILASQFNGEIDLNHSWLKKVEGTETAETFYKEVLVSRENLNIELDLIPFAPDPDLEIWQENLKVADLLQSFNKFSDPQKSSKGLWERQKEENLREHFKTTTLDMLLETLSQLIQRKASLEQLHGTGENLRDFLIAFPNEALQIPDYLKQFVIDDADGYHGSVINDALSNAGHEEAQQALVAIMADDAQQHQHRLTAIVNSGFLDDPQPFVIDQLQSLVQFQEQTQSPEQLERSNTSLLALGVSSFYLNQNHRNELAKTPIAFIKGFLEQASTDPEKSVAVSALANARSEGLLPTIRPFLQYRDHGIRANAIRAFRYYPSDEATQILAENFEQNSSGEVRKLAFEALKERSTPEIVEKVQQRLNTEKADDIRIGMIEYLGSRINTDPKIEETLKQQLQKSISKDEMKAIYEAIARKQTAQKADNGNQ